jgi:triacylglycerol esterase/lipase EstA (alpha/beta hydrolase family)
VREWWIGLSGRRRGLLAVVALAVVAGVAALVATLVPGGDPLRREGVGPVLLVPGYGGSRDSLSTLAGRIRATGREATVLTLPGDGTGDLRAQVQVLDRAAKDALDAGAPSVDVIGYSAGGVVARLWVATEDGANAVRRVVTLGSPLHGTRIATAGGVLAPDVCPIACQQLSTGSALLAGVAGDPGVPWLSLWTENDRTVLPPESARLAGAVNVALQDVCADAVVAHSQLPADPLVTGLVLRALGRGELTPPGPGDCARLRASS